MKPRIILIEDDSELRESLIEYLALARLNVTGVGSAIELYQTLNSSSFDVAIVDIGLPDQSGYEVTEYLRNNTPMGIILLTARSSTEDRVRGYTAGADLFFVKPVDCQELASAIRNLVKRQTSWQQTFCSEQSTEWVLDKSHWTLRSPDGRSYKLTGKEMTFLGLLAAESGEAISRITLMDALDYDSTQQDNRALDALVRRLRRRFEANNENEDPIKTVHSIGYCFAAPIRILQEDPLQKVL